MGADSTSLIHLFSFRLEASLHLFSRWPATSNAEKKDARKRNQVFRPQKKRAWRESSSDSDSNSSDSDSDNESDDSDWVP